MWNDQEDQFLKLNYTKLTDKEIAKILKKNWRSISHRRNQLKLGQKRILVPWTNEEIEYLKKHFHDTKINEIKKNIKRSKGCIHAKARALGLIKTYLENNIQILLNSSNESLYWVGFLLADGCFYKGKHRGSSFYLRLGLSTKDYIHLKQFAKYTGILNVHSSIEKDKTSALMSEKRDLKMVNVSVAHPCIQELMLKYDIKERKTYNPPDFKKYQLTNDQFISLIIGFIDGDGSITVGNCPSIKIGIHKSWQTNLIFIRDYLYNTFSNKSKKCTITNKESYCRLEIGNRAICEGLVNFAIENKLPIMKRKWNKIRY